MDADMDFSLMTLEVDGTLRNPIVVIVLTLWSIALSLMAVLLALRASRVRQSGATRMRGALPLLGILVTGYLLTRPVVTLIGTMIYRLRNPTIVSVGFWYGPPSWIAPLVAGALYAATLLILKRRRTGQSAA